MNAVIEALEGIETSPPLHLRDDAEASSPVPVRKAGMFAPPPLRQARQRWSCTLGADDLRCLLQVIEGELIPQLLNSYSPARHAPDDRLASG